MHRTSKTRRLAVGGAVIALSLAACGSDEATSTVSETGATGTEMAGMDMSSMNMGDADATPASDVPDAELQTGTFVLLDTRPSGYDAVAGDAAIARSDAGTTVTIELTGLKPDVDYIAHLHDGPCADGGGKHYKFDADGPSLPPNEVHLAFTSDGAGNGFMTAENDMTAGDDAVSIVVHPVEFIDNKIACAEFG
jgi:Cu/Zn superoxide dismutase